ncbi:MAG: hypothetical protein Fur0021_10810 [Candidatus Promineifilaceae bacterium]
MTIDEIVDAIRNNRLRITDHADEEAQADELTFDEIFFSVFQGEIIEEYPGNKPTPVAWFMGTLSPMSLCIAYGPTTKITTGLC